MKYIFSVLFISLFSFAFPQQSSLLWEISGKGLKSPSYLYGTMHVRDARVFQFGDSVLYLFNKCKAFAGELVIDKSNPLAMLGLITMPKDTTLSILLSEEDYSFVKKKAEEKLGFLAGMIDKLKPIFTSAMLSGFEFQSDSLKSLDDYFQNLAGGKNMEVIGIETVEEQLAAIDRTSLKTQAEMLVKYLKEEDKNNLMIDKMVEIYISQDLEKLEQFVIEAQLPEVIMKSILTDRNRIMAERIDTIIKKRTTFIGIGAAHLGGKEGVIETLRKMGYKVSPVYSPFKAAKAGTPVSRNKDENGWYIYQSVEYKVSFPTQFRKKGEDPVISLDPSGTIFTVSEGKYSGKADKFLDEKLKEYKKEGVKVSESRKFEYNKIPALEVLVEKGGLFISTTYYCLKEKYVEMSVAGKKEDMKSEKVKIFFRSFKKL
jgi:uncharacterized protein YbaP (TraB family)